MGVRGTEMIVRQSTATAAPAPPRHPGAGDAGQFSQTLDRTVAAGATAATGRAVAAEALLALQEIHAGAPAPAGVRPETRRVVRRALASLRALQLAWLDAGQTATGLDELAAALDELPNGESPPEREALDALRLRGGIELARHGR